MYEDIEIQLLNMSPGIGGYREEFWQLREQYASVEERAARDYLGWLDAQIDTLIHLGASDEEARAFVGDQLKLVTSARKAGFEAVINQRKLASDYISDK